MNHDLKTLTQFFPYVKGGTKKFEIRVNDRNFKVGDTLRLREWIPCPECNGKRRIPMYGGTRLCDECKDMPEPGIYTGEECERRVTYITDFGQTGNRVVMSLSENTADQATASTESRYA